MIFVIMGYYYAGDINSCTLYYKNMSSSSDQIRRPKWQALPSLHLLQIYRYFDHYYFYFSTYIVYCIILMYLMFIFIHLSHNAKIIKKNIASIDSIGCIFYYHILKSNFKLIYTLLWYCLYCKTIIIWNFHYQYKVRT